MNNAKVTAGDKLRISASTYNALVEMLHDWQLSKGKTGIKGESLNDNIILVKNSTGADLQTFAVVAIDGVVFDPATAAKQFRENPVLNCITPTSATAAGKFAVLAESIPAGKIGHAWASGTCNVKVNIIDEAHSFADLKSGENILESGESGTAQILYKEDGTGEKWAVIRFGGGGSSSGGGENDTYFFTVQQSLSYDTISDGSGDVPEGDTIAGRSQYLFVPAENSYPTWPDGGTGTILDEGGANERTNYTAGQKVLVGSVLYECIADYVAGEGYAVDISPSTASDDLWSEVETDVILRVEGAIAAGSAAGEEGIVADFRPYIPWFLEGAVVSARKDSQGRYWLTPTLTFTGDLEHRSIGWDEEDRRIKAVISDTRAY